MTSVPESSWATGVLSGSEEITTTTGVTVLATLLGSASALGAAPNLCSGINQETKIVCLGSTRVYSVRTQVCLRSTRRRASRCSQRCWDQPRHRAPNLCSGCHVVSLMMCLPQVVGLTVSLRLRVWLLGSASAEGAAPNLCSGCQTVSLMMGLTQVVGMTIGLRLQA